MSTNQEKEKLTIQWEIPRSSHRNSSASIPVNFIMIKRIDPEIHNHKHSSAYLSFSKDNLNHFYKDTELKLAVSYNNDRLMFCFNPSPETPSFKLTTSGKMKLINNRRLVQDIYDFLDLDKNIAEYYLKAHYFDKVDDQEIYVMTPQNFHSKLPLSKSERNGQFNIHAKS